jgi:hypothetical protein
MINRQKKAFSLLEISAILIVIYILITMVITSTDILSAARLNNARNITKSSIVNEITGVTLWLDSTSVKSFDDEDIEDGDEIENWNDIKQSISSSYVATSPTTKRPLYDEDAINKLPGVKFDGSDDYMQIANFKANGYFTLFVAGKFTIGSGNNTFFIEHGSNSSLIDGFHFYGYGASPTRVRRSSIITAANNVAWFGSDAAIAVLKHDGVGLSYKKNDDVYVNISSTINNSITTNTLNIGSRNGSSIFSNGSFGEIIMYDRALSDSEVDDIVEYLNDKWEIY